ncbi:MULTISPECIES: hypothetical protein [Streptomyces]|uniref:Uncharacterized protein n=2 Tax=Streptomyces TaxID=1883 RepID=A0A100Y679_9ACTN|nr:MULTISPECIES: hypothetical protein [Streptomyces]KUH38401.1 hypothetical protein ATE80_13105 [Streptomyces kanasensis]UUS30849.1 hypothetical protein NRO40_08365 [Streptomyces changanensis]
MPQRSHASQPDEALQRVRDLQAQAAADYQAAQSPATQAAARDQHALAISHAQESAGANTRR